MGAILKHRKPARLWDAMLADTQPAQVAGRDVHVPDVDIEKSSAAYKVRAALPGVRAEDLNVEVRDGRLIISGRYPSPKVDSEYRKVYSERPEHREFRRELRLEDGRFDGDGVKARLDRGLLTVKLPLRAEAQARKIEVRVE